MGGLLEIENLAVEFQTPGGVLQAVNGISYGVDAGEIVALVGESGSGKSVSALAVLGLVPTPPGRIASGHIRFDGNDLLSMDEEAIRGIRGRHISMIFQEPMTSLNPVLSIRRQLSEAMKLHLGLSKRQARARAVELLNMVGMSDPESRLAQYPHQLSGGQRQRMMMARAYLLKPSLIVADEPVSMVDASLRAMILDIMLRLRDESNISFLYITHDLSTAYQISDDIFLLYQGTISEAGDATKIIENPKHPYVQALLGSIPVPDPTQRWGVDIILPDDEEQRTHADSGCRFYSRCPQHMDKCLTIQPPLFMVDGPDHLASCYLYEDQSVAATVN